MSLESLSSPASPIGHKPSVRKDPKKLREVRLAEVSREIWVKVESSQDYTKRFICYEKLETIWDIQLVNDIFYDSGLTEEQRRRIKTDLLRFLSFMVYIGVPERWYSECRERLFQPPSSAKLAITDDDLPIPREQLLELGVPSHASNKDWHDQYIFKPAIIHFGLREQQRLDQNIRLPLCDRAKEVERGGYGQVEFWRIPSQHAEGYVDGDRRWHLKEPLAVAVKCYRPKEQDRQNASKEVETLCRLKGTLTTPKTALALHHAVIEHGQDFYIILPFANLGNLWQFLNAEKAMTDSGEKFQQATFPERFPAASLLTTDLSIPILAQSVAIADALSFLHAGFSTLKASFNMAHMDLKPNNILVFEDKDSSVGAWKLADFGISVVKEITGIRGPGNNQATMLTTPRRDRSTYQAPEVYLPQEEAEIIKVGRKSDIWSYGAIFSELLTFCRKRARGVGDFADFRERQTEPGCRDDRFYSPKRGPAGERLNEFQLRPEVSGWLERLCNEPGAPKYVTCWAKCIKEILIADKDKRPDADTVVKYVRHVLDHARQSPETSEIQCDFDRVEESVGNDRSPEMNSSMSFAARMAAKAVQRPTIGDVGSSATYAEPTASHAVQHPISKDERRSSSASTAEYSPLPESFEFRRSSLQSSSAPITAGSSSSGQRTSSSSWAAPTRGRLHSADTTASNGSIPGSGTDTHGAMCSPDHARVERARKQLDFFTKELSGSKSLGIDWDASMQWGCIAYLGKSTINLYTIDPLSGGASHGLSIELPHGPKALWTGVDVAGRFAVAWGELKQGRNLKSLLYVGFLGRDQAGQLIAQEVVNFHQSPLWSDVENFDASKRVAVSRQNRLALVDEDKLFIIALDTGQIVVRGVPPRDRLDFMDVAFNEAGDILYAWAKGQRNALFSYRALDMREPNPFSIAYYGWETGGKENTGKLYPYNTSKACIIATSKGTEFFPTLLPPISKGNPPFLERRISEQLRLSEVRSALVFNDHSIITLLKPLYGRFGRNERAFRVEEFPLGNGKDGVPEIGEGKVICTLECNPDKEKQTRFKVFQYQDHLHIYICHLSGKMETIKFSP